VVKIHRDHDYDDLIEPSQDTLIEERLGTGPTSVYEETVDEDVQVSDTDEAADEVDMDEMDKATFEPPDGGYNQGMAGDDLDDLMFVSDHKNIGVDSDDYSETVSYLQHIGSLYQVSLTSKQDSSSLGEGIELIAISEGCAANRDLKNYYDSVLEGNHPERTQTFPNYEFYNVLCIEWEDGIAYRKGVGRVDKVVWDRQDIEWVELMLG
jgi:hypothetical protein